MQSPSSSVITTTSSPIDPDKHRSAKSIADAEKGRASPAGPDEDQVINQTATDTKEQEGKNLVGWNGDEDPENPTNWAKGKKYAMTLAYASLTFCLTFSSSIFSTSTSVTAKLFQVSPEVMTLGTSLFVLVRVLFALMNMLKLFLCRVSPLALSYGGPCLNCTEGKFHSSLALDVSRSCKSPSLLQRTSKPSCCVDSGRYLWICALGHRWRCIGRLLGSRGERICSGTFQWSNFHRSGSWAYRWWLRHYEPSRLAMDGMANSYHECLLWDPCLHHLLGILRACASSEKCGQNSG